MTEKILNRMIEVELTRDDGFLIVKETLTRMGVASDETKKLFQSCHILHKRGKYYITHFKLLFELDGNSSNIDAVDLVRQYTIASLLESWNLLKIVSKQEQLMQSLPKLVKVISNTERDKWELVSKHRIGRNKR